ncbi:MAG: sulfatase, partial [Planctomycetota bacterium]
VHEPLEADPESVAMFSSLPVGERHRDVLKAAMIYDLDRSIGLLWEKIRRLGIEENTYLIVMSDNGGFGRPPGVSCYPLAGGKGSLYEGGIRVPLVVVGPGVKAGSVCREPVVGYDLFPTIAELAGVKRLPEKVDGVSIVPLLRGEAKSWDCDRPLVFHYPHYGRGVRQTPCSAIRVGDYKLLRDYETGTDRLFCLKDDIGETRDLSTAMPAKAAELARLLDRYLTSVDAGIPSPNPDYRESSPAEPTRPRSRRRAGTSRS